MDKIPLLTVDAIIHKQGEILLIKRNNPPFKDKWALPGGFIEYGETTEEAVLREAREETGLEVEVEKLLGVYSKPDRDPRGHTISAVYICRIIGGKLKAGSDAAEAKRYKIKKLPELAFDHKDIIEDFINNHKTQI